MRNYTSWAGNLAVAIALLLAVVTVKKPSYAEVITSVGVENDGSVELSFINFSSEPINFFEHNGIKFMPDGTINAYETKTVRTAYGKSYAYSNSDKPDNKHPVLPNAPATVAVNNGGDTKSIQVVCGTTKGDIRMIIEPSWSPLGAGRFLHLVHTGYLDGCALNRVVPKFLTQLGIGTDYKQRSMYRSSSIPDDPPKGISFQPGTMAFAGSGPNSRSSEFFIVMPDTPQHQLDFFGTNPWETPFGYVEPDDVANVVAKWHSYGDMPPWGQGPDPSLIFPQDGYDYLKREFPKMDYIKTCRIGPDSEVKHDEL
ncbi:cyclophilin type peptidyl-prolyl cis-trans isomerase [Nitzschia inconspicua]|uniref:Cyclophilin type peptidyl-prolyl cis-trans isomerase n=1 Tax=Nitzschia inconspicua TaxID=303405 RepID=A0A9K3PD69_9STRA|nr:cyclophilin type peptidyl-prolyl cis-trans isomerase [Nitzschia inconspicua]